MTNQVDTVILDLDGTLLDSTEDIATALDRVLVARSLPPAGLGHTQGWIGDGAAVLIERALAWAAGRPATAQEAASALSDFMNAYGDCCCQSTRLAPNMPELLDSLAKFSVSMAVASNKPERFCTRILEHLGINSRFAAVIGGDSTERRKPDPLPLRSAVMRAKGKVAWMIGDSEIDRHAAAAAGYPFIGLAGGYRPTHPEELAPEGPSEVIGIEVSTVASAVRALHAAGAPLTFASLKSQIGGQGSRRLVS